MRLFSVGLLTALFVPLAGLAGTAKQVEVTNLPAVQEVTGAVEVINLPELQDVTGTVEVTNDPANPVEVVGEVAVTNFPTPTTAARYRLVGFTSALFNGGRGVRTYTQACQADFLSAARMCTSEEVLNTVAWPEVPGEIRGWLRPVFQPTGDGVADASGVGGGTSGDLTCLGWSLSLSSFGGSTVSGDGRFAIPYSGSRCNVARPVACCAPVP